MSLPQTLSGLWEPSSPITVTPDDMQEIRAEASRCLLVHQVEVFEAKQGLSWNSEHIVEAATQLLNLLLERPDRRIIRLIYMFAENLNLEPMETVNYALNTWRASSAHFSEDAHYIEGDQEISAIGTNAILLATLDWRPGPEVRPWLRMSLMVVNAASAALSVALTILRQHRLRNDTRFGGLELVEVHQKNHEGLQMFLQATLDTIRRSQIDRGVNAGQELGLVLGANIQLSRDLNIWTLQNDDEENFSPASLLHPARKALGSPWRKFCLCHGVGNEFIQSSIPPRLGMLEFRVPGILERMYTKKRSSYMWLRVNYRQLNRGVQDRSGKGTIALFKHLARQTSLPYSNASDAAVTPAQEMEVPFHNYDMTHQPITDTKGFLSFPFMTSVIQALDKQEEEQEDAEEDEEVTIDYTHYLVDPSSAFQ